MRGCSSTTARSSGVSAPGLSRMRSEIPSLPTSCSSEPKTSSSRRAGPTPTRAATGVDPAAVGDGGDEPCDVVAVPAQERILGFQRTGEDAHGAEVRRAQLAAQPAVLQHRAGMVAEGEQDLVLDLGEAAGSIGADHDAGELAGDVDGDGDEVVELPVGVVVAQRLVAAQRLAGEALDDARARGVVG